MRITYTPLAGEEDRKFESEVSSHKRSAGPESKASTGMLKPSVVTVWEGADAIVAGTETLTPK